jgi:hypothetical protein
MKGPQLTVQRARYLSALICRLETFVSYRGYQPRPDGWESRELCQEHSRMAYQTRISRWSRSKGSSRQRMSFHPSL